MGLSRMLREAASDAEKSLDAEKSRAEAPEIKKEANMPEPAMTEKPQKRRGHPTNEEYGLPTRKQYSLNLFEADYRVFFARARAEGLSFSKFIEKAAKEYMENH